MAQFIRRLALPLVFGSALMLGACQSDDAPKADSGLAADSALSRDIALANRDSGAQPQLQDIPAAPAETPAAQPAATPPKAPARTSTTRSTPSRSSSSSSSSRPATGGSSSSSGRTGTIASGAELSLASGDKLCTNEPTRVGSTISARVTQAVRGSNGAIIPEGAVVTLEVTELKRSENVRDKAVIGLRPVAVTINGQRYAISGEVVGAQTVEFTDQPKGKTAQKVAIGAAAGAIAGQILGKNTKSTVIGAAAGAAAGAGVAAATTNKGACLNEGADMTVRLTDGVSVRV